MCQMACRICYEDGALVSVCGCTGTHQYVHIECVQKWMDISNKRTCELCLKPFVHKSLRKTRPECELTLILPMSVGMFHGTITWVSLFENLTIEIFFIETFCCLILVAGVRSVRNVSPWKLFACFYAAFLISNVPPMWLVPVTAYNLNIIIPHAANFLIAVVFSIHHRKVICRRC